VCPDHAAVGKAFEHHIPNARLRPTAELPPERVPVTELGRQITPRRAGPVDPENALQDASVIAWRPAAPLTGRRQKRLENRPFLIRHQTANHS